MMQVLAVTALGLIGFNLVGTGRAGTSREQNREIGSIADSINPIAKGKTSFEFKPLFPTNPSFVYAFDAQTVEEAQNNSIAPGTSPTPYSNVAVWLEYTGANLTRSTHEISEIILLMSENITGTPSGGNNGCDGVWGPACSNDLIAAIKGRIAEAAKGPSFGLYYTIRDWALNAEFDFGEFPNISCPQGWLGGYFYPLWETVELFADPGSMKF
jgi:hypothetical protein